MGLWVEADILAHLATESALFQGTAASCCEHFEERVGSGQREALDTRRGHPHRGVAVATSELHRSEQFGAGVASSPSEKHGWRVLGGMMGPVQ